MIMKVFFVFFIFLLGVWFCHCSSPSNPNLNKVKDSVTYYDYNLYCWSGGIGCFNHNTIVIRLNYDLFITISLYEYQKVLSFYDTLRDTTITIELLDFSNINLFVEYCLNSYFNHYPLSHNDLEIINNLIKYTFFYYWCPYNSYRMFKQYSKMNHILVTNLENDTLSKCYNIALCDTIYNIKTDIQLKYTILGYKFAVNNFPREIIRSYQQ